MASAPRMARASVSPAVTAEFSSDVVVGLSQPGQKELPSKYLYDEVGSALFDVICLLPEYGLSRAGMRLLQRDSHEIVYLLPTPVLVAELGSGSGQKTRLLLQALSKRQRVNYYPIDISGSALSRCQQEIGQMDRVSIVGFESAYLEGLQEVAARRQEGERILVLFLGSTIGNFDRPAGDQFLREVRKILSEGDALLLATDLVKPIEQLLLAYDDPAGVTAAFNMNLLSKAWQRVTIQAANQRFYLREGETIWTESSHKYNPAEVVEMGERTGFRCERQWFDAEWPFAQNLFFAV